MALDFLGSTAAPAPGDPAGKNVLLHVFVNHPISLRIGVNVRH